MNSAKMNSKTHKIITAIYYPVEQHFVVPIDWEIEDIEIGFGLLSYKGEEKNAPVYEMEGDTKYPSAVAETDWEDVAGFFDCCESEEEEEEVFTQQTFEAVASAIVEEEEEEKGCVKCYTCDEAEATHKVFRDALGEYEHTCDKCFKKEYEEEEEKEKQLNAVKTIIKYVYRYVLGYHEDEDGYGRCDCGGGYNTCTSCFWHYEEYEYACLKCRDLAEEGNRHDICTNCYNRECECEEEEEEE